MNTIDVLSKAKNRGIRLWVENGALKYKAPPGSLDEELRSQIGNRKNEIVAFLQQALNGVEDQDIRRVDRSGRLPLSHGQKWMWLSTQMESASTFNIPAVFRIRGPLNVPDLERSLGAIVDRHEILRTNYTVRDGEIIQVISEKSILVCHFADRESASPADSETEVQHALREEMEAPFDLSVGLPLRARLIRLSKNEHTLILCFHHIVCDNQSLGLFLSELTMAYEAFSSGRAPEWEKLPLQYADFAAWQQRRLSGIRKEQLLAFWRERLRGLGSSEDITWDFPRPEKGSHTSIRRNFLLDEGLARGLRELSQREGSSLYATLLSAWKILLFQYSGKGDTPIGSPAAGRGHPQWERLIGLFFNTIVVRGMIDGAMSFLEVLDVVKQATLEALAHQDAPFEMLIEELKPQRRGDRTPFFQVLFNMYSVRYETRVANLLIEPFDKDSVGAQNVNSKFDVTVLAIEHERGLQLDFSFKSDLFAPGTVDWLTGHFRILLEAITRDPETSVANLPALGTMPPRGARIPHEFAAFPPEEVEQTIVRRFEKIATGRPSPAAVEMGEDGLSYGELKDRADAVNALIRNQLGETGGGRIALMISRGVPIVAAVLGVLKSGHAFVILDGEYPPDRLKYILKDSASCLILTDDVHSPLVCSLAEGLPVLELSDPRLASLRDPVDHAGASDPAYIVYTSGSTGNPKGVVQTHRNVLHYTMNYINGLHIGEDDILSLIPSFSFSAAMMDLFAALCSGAGLRLYDIKKNGPQGLGAWLAESRVTVYHSVPTVFRRFLAHLEPSRRFPALRLIDLGGEPVSRLDLELFRRHFTRDCRLVNGLGATELNVIRQFAADHETVLEGDLLPVGYAVPDTDVQLLDEEGRPVGYNQVGEIVIQSRYLSPGYWNLDEQTHARFERLEDGTLRYRTGDLGRLRPDGCLEHLGRLDLQVKIRGVRIEPLEVEAALLKFPGVKEAVVTAQEKVGGEKFLMAHLVTDSPASSAFPMEDLRTFLLDHLPEAMVPSELILLHQLPLTSTGKVDRRALPRSDDRMASLKDQTDSSAPPRTPLEERLAQMWREALKIERVGVHDSFFKLGGDSLIAAQFVAASKSLFGFEISFRVLFRMQTIAQIARHIEETWEAQARSEGASDFRGIRETGEL